MTNFSKILDGMRKEIYDSLAIPGHLFMNSLEKKIELKKLYAIERQIPIITSSQENTNHLIQTPLFFEVIKNRDALTNTSKNNNQYVTVSFELSKNRFCEYPARPEENSFTTEYLCEWPVEPDKKYNNNIEIIHSERPVKIRNRFVSNSSSCSFVIKNKSSQRKDLVDFIKENPNLIEEFKNRYSEQSNPEFTQEKLIKSARENHDNIYWEPGERKQIVFGDEQGTLVGRVFDYILRDGGNSESFTYRFHEMLR